jgi:hypothetical protein
MEHNLLFNHPVPDEDGPVSGFCKLGIVGDHTIVRLNLLDSILSRSNTSLPVLMSRLPVGRLISKDYRRAIHERSCYCDPLLLAPAQGSRLEVCLVADVEYFKERSGTPLPVCAASCLTGWQKARRSLDGRSIYRVV